MIKRFYALMLIPLLLASCNKIEPTNDIQDSDTSISFAPKELSADWESKSSTRGVAVDDINTVDEIMVYAFVTRDGATTAPYINNQAATMDKTSKIWSFKPAQFYPLYETLDFLAYTPQADLEANGITQELDFANKGVKIGYAVPLQGRQQPDLMLATPATEKSRTTQLENLNFNHVLTKITMSAKMADGTQKKYKGRYKITGFTLHNIQTDATLDYRASSIGEWGNGEYGDFVVGAMLPGEDPAVSGESPALLTTGDYQNVMTNGQALFMIPQPIEGSEYVNGKPSIEITITDTKPTTVKENGKDPVDMYLTYRSGVIELPSPSKLGWQKGQAIDLQFDFKFDPEQFVIPMSLTAKLMPWTEQTVDKEIDPNIYAWFDENSVPANQETQLKLFTNGVLKSVSGISAAMGAKSGDYYPITVTAGAAGTETLEVVIENSQDKTITKKFIINVE